MPNTPYRKTLRWAKFLWWWAFSRRSEWDNDTTTRWSPRVAWRFRPGHGMSRRRDMPCGCSERRRWFGLVGPWKEAAIRMECVESRMFNNGPRHVTATQTGGPRNA